MKRRTFFQASFAVATVTALMARAIAPEIALADGHVPDTIRFAVTDVVGLEELRRDFEPFRDALEAATGKEIKFFPVADRAAAAVALQADQVDVVLAGPAEYVVLRARTQAEPFIGLTRLNYRSVIAVRSDSGIASLEDLKGRKMAMSDIGSTSGHLGPSQILAEAGLEPRSDVDVLMLGDADLQAFENGDVDAWGGSALDYERFFEDKSNAATDFPILVKGESLPNDVFMASDDLDPEFVATLAQQMVNNQEALIDAIVSVESNRKYVGSSLIPAQDSDYDPMRVAYRAVGVNEFSEFIGD
ncbi:MAG: phosphate/phosphite/phosphonate ABC transporter substrate-binding protein [Cyanobacteria bacterium J06639_1]